MWKLSYFQKLLGNIYKGLYLGCISYDDTLRILIKCSAEEDFGGFEKNGGLILCGEWLYIQFKVKKSTILSLYKHEIMFWVFLFSYYSTDFGFKFPFIAKKKKLGTSLDLLLRFIDSLYIFKKFFTKAGRTHCFFSPLWANLKKKWYD